MKNSSLRACNNITIDSRQQNVIRDSTELFSDSFLIRQALSIRPFYAAQYFYNATLSKLVEENFVIKKFTVEDS